MTNPNDPTGIGEYKSFLLHDEINKYPALKEKLFAWAETSKGLTKREYFAAMAMQGILSMCNLNPAVTSGDIAIMAVLDADALIDELNKISNESRETIHPKEK